MTEYQLVDLVASYNAIVQSWNASYFTLLTAYLVVAYSAGSRLTRFQAGVASTCFVVSCLMCAWAQTGALTRALEFATEARSLNPERDFAVNPALVWVSTVLLLLGIVVGLRFMWDVRHTKA